MNQDNKISSVRPVREAATCPGPYFDRWPRKWYPSHVWRGLPLC